MSASFIFAFHLSSIMFIWNETIIIFCCSSFFLLTCGVHLTYGELLKLNPVTLHATLWVASSVSIGGCICITGLIGLVQGSQNHSRFASSDASVPGSPKRCCRCGAFLAILVLLGSSLSTRSSSSSFLRALSLLTMAWLNHRIDPPVAPKLCWGRERSVGVREPGMKGMAKKTKTAES